MNTIVISEFLSWWVVIFQVRVRLCVPRGLCFVSRDLIIIYISLITAQNFLWFRLKKSAYISSFYFYHHHHHHHVHEGLAVLYVFFWVIPRPLNFICRRFGTLCLFHLHRQVGVEWLNLRIVGVFIREKVWLENSLSQTFSRMDTPAILKFSHSAPTCLWRWNRQSVPKRRYIKFRRREIIQKKTYNIQNTAKVWNQGLGVFPVPWTSRWSWSLHLFLGRPVFLHPFGLYCNTCFGILFVPILCTCCSHFSWCCFISFTMLCAPFFSPNTLILFLSGFVIPSKCLKNFICAGKSESDELCDSIVIGRIILKLMLGNKLLECTICQFSSGHR